MDITWNIIGCNSITVQFYVDGFVTAEGQTCNSGANCVFSIDPSAFANQCKHSIQIREVTTACGGFQPLKATEYVFERFATNQQCRKPAQCNRANVGGPVNVADGKMWYETEDLRLDGPLPLVWSRRFVHDNKNTLGPLGYGWTHPFNLFLSGINYTDAEGRQLVFPPVSSGFSENRRDHLMKTGASQITTKDQTRYNFTAGRLTSIVDRNGNTLALSYDGSNRLTRISDYLNQAAGRALTFTYTGASTLISTVSDGTRTVAYNYTGQDLTSVVDAAGKNWTYGYDGTTHRLSTITDPLGHLVEGFTYNGADQVQTFQKDSGNNALTFTYAAATTTVANSRGVNTVFTFDTVNFQLAGVPLSINGPLCTACGASGQSVSYQYDNYLNKTQITDGNNNITKQTFDTLVAQDSAFNTDNVIQRIEAFGTVNQRIIDFTYDPTYNFIASRTEPSVYVPLSGNRVETWTYDATGAQCSTSNGFGNLCSHSVAGRTNDAAGNPVGFTHTTRYTYDGHGQALTIDGPRASSPNDLTTSAYYADTDPILALRGRVKTITNALGHLTTYNAYTLSGKPTDVDDPNLVKTLTTYDNLDRVTSVTVKDTVVANDLVTQYTLNNVGLSTTTTLPRGNTIGSGYDPVNRLTTTTVRPTATTVNTANSVYDAEGNRCREDFKDNAGIPTKVTNFLYDNFNRLQFVFFTGAPALSGSGGSGAQQASGRNGQGGEQGGSQGDQTGNQGNIVLTPGCVPGPAPTGPFWQYGYDGNGNLTEIRDPLGHRTCHGYDALNRRTATKQFLGAQPADCAPASCGAGCTAVTTQFGYDTQDHLKQVTDPNNLVTTYNVDDEGNTVKVTSPDTGATTYAFDEANNLTQKVNANGITESRVYDPLNRLTNLNYPADSTQNVTYAYDGAADPFGKGRRTGMTDHSGVTTYAHDCFGRLQSESLTPTGFTKPFTTNYGYDKNGNVTALTYPSSRLVNYTYDLADQNDTISAAVNSATTSIATGMTYAPFGPRTAMTFGNTLADARTYDSRYRMGNWTLGTLINKSHAWFDDDNLNLITDNLAAGNNRSFGYDELHRLTAASTGANLWGTGSYGYDANGNRLSKTEGSLSATYAYTAGTNRLASATSSTPGEGGVYAYDANGNITNDSQGAPQIFSPSSYSYSQRDRLSLVNNGVDNQVGYDYSGDGARTRKEFSFVFFARQLVFNASGKLIEELNPDGLPPGVPGTRDYIWLPGKYESVAIIDHVDTSDSLYFVHDDHLGTPIAATNASGALVWRVEHRPFGGIFSQSVATITNNLRFPGQYYDFESGLAQNGFRDYSAKLGRYIEPDPIGIDGGTMNFYSYTGNDPTRYIDPYGLGHQNPGCDKVPECIQMNPRWKRCCFEHDKCYLKYNCNQGSWTDTLRYLAGDYSAMSACVVCNLAVVDCLAQPVTPRNYRASSTVVPGPPGPSPRTPNGTDTLPPFWWLYMSRDANPR